MLKIFLARPLNQSESRFLGNRDRLSHFHRLELCENEPDEAASPSFLRERRCLMSESRDLVADRLEGDVVGPPAAATGCGASKRRFA